jgi:hypothetical protein
MKTKLKQEWMFGDLIATATQVRGADQTEPVVRLAIHVPGRISGAVTLSNFFRGGMVRMNKANRAVDRIKMGLGIALLATLIGCVGYGGGGYGGPVVVADPDVTVFGGGYYGGGHDIHAYSQRGAASRAVAHPVGRR